MSGLSAAAFGAFVGMYTMWKLVLRQYTGSKPDERGWGLEAYVSAFIHQTATLFFGAALFLSQNNLDAWLAGPWKGDGESQRAEEYFLLMQAAEMATDVLRDRKYPGFGVSYLAHHVATFLATLAALFMVVPVGGVIGFATCMEGGGAVLNAVSLYPKVTNPRDDRAKAPPALITARVLLFTASRLVAAVVLAKTTVAAAALEPPPWAAIVFAWAILAVNTKWVWAMLRSLHASILSGKGVDSMDAFCE